MFYIKYMEGFINTNVMSPFDYGLKHSSRYANYGVDKITPNREQPNQTTSVKPDKGANNLLGANLINTDILDDIAENIDKTMTETVDTIATPNKDNHQRLKMAGIITASAVVVGGLVLGLTRGKLSKKMVTRLNELIEKGNIKIEELKQKPSESKLDEYYLGFLQTVNKGVSRLRGTFFNITPLKDAMFKRLVQQKCHLEKPCNAITNTFRKLSFGTVKSAYSHAQKDLDEFMALAGETNQKIASGEIKLKNPVVDKTLETVDKSVKSLKTKFDFFFGEKALNCRNERLINRFDGLSDRVYDHSYGQIKDFVGDVDEWTTFVSEKLVAKDKSKIIANLAKKKKIITNNPQDVYNNMSLLISNLTQSVNPKDTKTINSLKTLKNLSYKYMSVLDDGKGAERQEIISEIAKEIDGLKDISMIRLGDRLYNVSQYKHLKSIIKEFETLISTDKKGMVEDLLSFYRGILPEADYLKLKQSAMKLSKSLNRAVHKEGFEYVDKARDLAVGSALTDVAIGMGLPLGTTTIAMSVADTKQKKRSVALKYGIPLLMGVGTSTLCTIALISGGQALLLGSAVSLIGNEILERLDNYLIKRDNKKKNLST